MYITYCIVATYIIPSLMFTIFACYYHPWYSCCYDLWYSCWCMHPHFVFGCPPCSLVQINFNASILHCCIVNYTIINIHSFCMLLLSLVFTLLSSLIFMLMDVLTLCCCYLVYCPLHSSMWILYNAFILCPCNIVNLDLMAIAPIFLSSRLRCTRTNKS